MTSAPLDLDELQGHLTKCRQFPEGASGDLYETLKWLSLAHSALRELLAERSRDNALIDDLQHRLNHPEDFTE